MWSKRKAAASFAGLVCTVLTIVGFVHSQQATPRPAATGNSENTITIDEPGKPQQKGVIQKTTRLADGKVAHEVRNLSTGEVFTLYAEGGSAAAGKADNTPWVKSKQSAAPAAATKEQPVWTPISPSAAPAKTQAPVSPASAAAAPAPVEQFRVIEEAGKPQLKCKVVKEWRTAEGHKAAQLQAVDSGEFLTLVEIGSTEASAGTPASNAKVTAKLYRWGSSKTPPAGVPVPPASPAVGDSPRVAAPSTLSSKAPPKTPSKAAPTVVPAKSTIPDRVKDTGSVVNRNPVAPLIPPVAAKAAPQKATSGGKAASPSKATNGTPTTTVAKAVEIPAKPQQPAKAADVAQAGQAKTSEGPTTAGTVKTGEAEDIKTVDAPKVLEAVIPSDAAKAVPAPTVTDKEVLADVAKTPEQPAQGPGSQGLTLPKVPEPAKELAIPAPQIPEVNKTAEAPKADNSASAAASSTTKENAPAGIEPKSIALPTPPAPPPAAAVVPPAPPSAAPLALPTPPVEDKKALPSVDAKVPALSKATTDSTLPSAAPPVPPQPTVVNVMPSLPPSASMPSSLSSLSSKTDPLSNPESYSSPRVEKETGKPSTVGMAQAGDGPRPNFGAAQAGDGPRFPAGTASIMAAANGGDPQYAPAPMMNVPQGQPTAPPMGSAFQAPPAMDSGAFVNAFTTPMTPEAQQQAAVMAQMQRQMMAMAQQGNPQVPAYPAMQQPGQMQRSYQGPLPPNPTGTAPRFPMPQMPQAYPMPAMTNAFAPPMMPMQPTPAFSNSAMDRPGMQPAAAAPMHQSINTLQSSIFPSQREQAVMQLSTCDWRKNPQVVQLLLTSAKEDAAPMVRAACVSGLVRMGVASDAATATYNQLLNDADPRVRAQAEQALARTGGVNPVQPVGGVNRY